MYHFLFVVSKRIFPNGFDITHKVDPDKEQIIDFCPKCDEKLEDKKIITLRKHDQKFHPKTDKELVRRFYTRGAMPMFITIGIVVILFVIFLGAVFITNQMFKDSLTEDETQYMDFCKELLDNMPQYPALGLLVDRDPITIERGEYVLENLKDFEECFYSASYRSLGDREERLEYFQSSLGEK